MADLTWKPMMDPFGRSTGHLGHATIWVQRLEWPEPQKSPASGLHPMLNAVGLYWRPAIEGEPAPNLHDWARQMDWVRRELNSSQPSPSLPDVHSSRT